MSNININPEEMMEYMASFMSQLGSVVGKVHGFGNNPIRGDMKASSLYLPEMINSAAIAGYEMKLPEETALAIFTLAQATGYGKTIGVFGKLMPGEKKSLYNSFCLVVNELESTISTIDHKLMANYMKHLNSILKKR